MSISSIRSFNMCSFPRRGVVRWVCLCLTLGNGHGTYTTKKKEKTIKGWLFFIHSHHMWKRFSFFKKFWVHGWFTDDGEYGFFLAWSRYPCLFCSSCCMICTLNHCIFLVLCISRIWTFWFSIQPVCMLGVSRAGLKRKRGKGFPVFMFIIFLIYFVRVRCDVIL